MLSQAQRPALPPTLQKLYPYPTRQLNLGEERINFVEAGNSEASPIVFVHGGLSWSFLFRQAIQACAEKFHVIAADHVGFGLSSKPARADYHTLDRHIANLSALMDALNLQRITLVLHEWGGPLGLGFATRFPQKVERIVLLNTWTRPDATDLNRPWQLRLLRTFAGSVIPSALLNSALHGLAAKPLSSDVLSGYQYPLTQPNGVVGPLAFTRMLPLNTGGANACLLDEIASNLKNVMAKVEILWGKRDPILRSPLRAYVLRDSFPNAVEPRWLENAGLLVPEDAPAEFNEVLLAPFRPKPQAPKPVFNILK